MNIKQMLQKYYRQSIASKSEGQCNFEMKNINGLIKCFDDLNVEDTDQLTEDVWYEMVDWYRDVLLVKNTTATKRLSYLRTVLKYYRIKSVFFEMRYPQSDKTPFTRFQDNEVTIIFETVNQLMEVDPDNVRLKMLVLMTHLLLDTGVRNTELFEMKTYNVDLVNRFIFLDHTKNKKKEPVLFSAFSEPLLRDVVLSRYHSEYLFWEPIEKRPMTFNKDLRPFFMKLEQLTGIEIYCHRFRKTYGTAMYMQTHDWRFTQKALRHSDMRSTQIYVDETLEFLRECYDKASQAFEKFKSKK